MTFNEQNVNREQDGKFGAKQGAASEVSLESEAQWTVRVKGKKVFTGPYDEAARRAESEAEMRPDVSVTTSPARP